MMVLAGPGSGKTAVIAARAAFLVQRGIPPRQILVITFSRAAAQEMKRRFVSGFPPGKAPAVTFGTFHSVFFRILQSETADLYPYEARAVLSESERRSRIRGFLAENHETDEELLSALLGEMSLVRNELHDMAHYHAVTIGSADFKRIHTLYEKHKKENNQIDFDDMLCRAYELLQTQPKILQDWRKRFPYIMIDEFQDINRVQYEAVRLLAAPGNHLFIVGDDDQSIYRFRGSRPEFLLNFPRDFPGAKQVTLGVNYRSTDPIIAFANSLIAENKHRYPKKITGTQREGPVPVLIKTEDPNREALRIGERIRKLQQNGADLDGIAVAFRLNIQARAFADAFLHLNIPYRARDEMPLIYEHWIAEDLFAYLRLGIAAGSNEDAMRIVNKPYRFINKAFLEGLSKRDKNVFEAYPRDKTLHISQKIRLEELHEDIKNLRGKKTVDAICFIRRKIGYNTHIIDHCDYRKLDPAGLTELADELQEAAKAHPEPRDFLTHAQNSTMAKTADAPAGPCVTLTTLHSAKGLEFERVFIAGVIEDVIPHSRSKTEAEIEEERRLLYVGITRARRELFLSVIRSRYDKIAEPSRFIRHFT
jgi:DNA helicase-2/ATP-dependent DNA helicase PcrA